jgi:hypothetical protein
MFTKKLKPILSEEAAKEVSRQGTDKKAVEEWIEKN